MRAIFNINNELIGKFIQRYEKLDSTNNEALKYTDSKLENDGLVISTYEQIGGRGQRNATWFSDRSTNVTMSIVLFPVFLKVKDYFYLNICISNAIVKYINTTLGLNAKIKWPNDIFIGKNKIGGILVETSIQGVTFQSAVVGIGLNVNQDIFPDELVRASSIYKESKKAVDLDTVLYDLTTYLDAEYKLLSDGAYSEMKSFYMDNLFLKDTPWCFYDKDSLEINGIIKDVNHDGQLIIEEEGRLHNFGFKEVRFF